MSEGSVKYINLRQGQPGTGLPAGSQAGQILRWNGAAWAPVLIEEIIAESLLPAIYNITGTGVIVNAVPAGYRLVQLTMPNTTGASVTVSIGVSNGDYSILDHETIVAGNVLELPVGRLLSANNDTSLYYVVNGVGEISLIVELKQLIP